MRRQVLRGLAALALASGVFFVASAWETAAAQPAFSVDRAGPGGYDPADLLEPGSPVAVPAVLCSELGFAGCGGPDDVDALSFGLEGLFGFAPVQFSVAAGSVGLPGTPVAVEAGCLPAEPQADVFASSGGGDQGLLADGDGAPCAGSGAFPLGLLEVPASEDLDALDAFDPMPAAPALLSLDPASPALALLGVGPADILLSAGGAVAPWASALALGLVAGDDLDAVCLGPDDDSVFELGVDVTLFSLAPGSPTLAFNGWSAADVLAATLFGPARAIPAEGLALAAEDDVDALACNLALLEQMGRLPPGAGTVRRGQPRDVSISPPAVDFGSIAPGSSTVSSILVTNAGTSEPLTIGTIAAPADPFSVARDDCSGHSLAPGDGCSIDVAFSPPATGSFSDTLSIPSDDPDEPLVDVPLSGQATAPAPELVVAPSSIDFGSIRVGETGIGLLTMHNVGDGELHVDCPDVPAPFVLSGVDDRPCEGSFAVPPGQQRIMMFAFPAAPPGGVVQRLVTIDTNDFDPVIELLGVSVAPPDLLAPDDGAVTAERPTFRFVAEPVGIEALTYVVEIRRGGELVGSIDQSIFPGLGWSKPSYASGEIGELLWPTELAPGEYEWRLAVRYPPSGVLSAFSASRRFVVPVPPPRIDSVFPGSVLVDGGKRRLFLNGEDFAPGARVLLTKGDRDEPGFPDVAGEVSQETQVSLVVDLDLTSDIHLGDYDLVVRNPDGQEGRVSVRVLPAIVFPATQPAGVLGFPVVSIGNERANYLQFTNTGNARAFFWMRLRPPEPGTIVLKLVSRTNPFWDSTREEDPSQVDFFLRLEPFQTYTLPMLWAVPPSAVVFPEPAPTTGAFAQFDPIEFGGEEELDADGGGSTVDQFKERITDAVKEAFLDPERCRQLGLVVAGERPLAEYIRGLIEDSVENFLDESQFQVITDPEQLIEEIGETLAENVPGVDRLQLAAQIGECIGQFLNGVKDAFDMAAKRYTDKLRSAHRSQHAALAQAIEDISEKAKPTKYWLDAIILNGGVLDQLGRPPCEPPLAYRATYRWPVRGPFDPNDKTFNGSYDEVAIVDGGEARRVALLSPARAADRIEYVITFENKPEATLAAEDVVVTDVLDADFDAGSLEVISSSHSGSFSTEVSGRTVTFRFTGINLEPNRNPPEGEGYVHFSVQPLAGLPLGTQLRNQASIVFDFNPPIATRETVHVIADALPVAIDIKPGEEPNPINVGSRGVTPVAVLASPAFDPRRIDVGTVLFEGAPVAKTRLEDVDRDGDVDRLLFFETQEIGLAPGRTVGVLAGLTSAGLPFRGVDSVMVLAAASSLQSFAPAPSVDTDAALLASTGRALASSSACSG